MKRSHRVASIALFFSIFYLLLFLDIVSLPLIDKTVLHDILPVVPWWLLVSFGSYALWSLGWGLYTFRDCPDAYQELLLEITEAKNDLRARGVTVD